VYLGLRAVTEKDQQHAHSILPLAVLEAMRHLDSPRDEEAAEYVDELLKKRLGLSDTVAAQIARYELAVQRDQDVGGEELEQILRLVGRRTDASLVFADGGRRAARRAMTRLSAPTRWAARRLPRFMRRLVGYRAARRCAADVFAASLSREGRAVTVAIGSPASIRATPDGAACAFYAAAFAELLRELVDFDGGMLHPTCGARGAARCEWRTTGAPERTP
jgi:bacteriochlorophyll 4-vinyl reductase